MLLPAFTGPAWSGGLYLNEFGTPSMGVAGAGANAVASDASTSFHNAAGMTRIKGKEVMGTGGLLYATVKFDPDRQRFAERRLQKEWYFIFCLEHQLEILGNTKKER